MIIQSSGARALLEVISMRAINWISLCTGLSKAVKYGITMVSSGNINREIQLIIDVIDYNMLKGKYLLGILSAYPMRLHNQPMRLQMLLCGDKHISTLKPTSTGIY